MIEIPNASLLAVLFTSLLQFCSHEVCLYFRSVGGGIYIYNFFFYQTVPLCMNRCSK